LLSLLSATVFVESAVTKIQWVPPCGMEYVVDHVSVKEAPAARSGTVLVPIVVAVASRAPLVLNWYRRVKEPASAVPLLVTVAPSVQVAEVVWAAAGAWTTETTRSGPDGVLFDGGLFGGGQAHKMHAAPTASSTIPGAETAFITTYFPSISISLRDAMSRIMIFPTPSIRNRVMLGGFPHGPSGGASRPSPKGLIGNPPPRVWRREFFSG
jgi:hypothetical protein